MNDVAPLIIEQHASVVASLRQGIIEGRFKSGSRMVEAAIAAALGVSRTPVRLAFRVLEQEGLLQKTGKRGLVVRGFSPADVLCALEVRGALEGLAARRLAERVHGPDVLAVLAVLQVSVDRGREVLAKGFLTPGDIDEWSTLNKAFHGAIVEAAGSSVIGDAIARNNHLPFASADSITLDLGALDREYDKLRIAQIQHELVLDALRHRESARVEMLMREHAYVGVRYASLLGMSTPALA